MKSDRIYTGLGILGNASVGNASTMGRDFWCYDAYLNNWERLQDFPDNNISPNWSFILNDEIYTGGVIPSATSKGDFTGELGTDLSAATVSFYNGDTNTLCDSLADLLALPSAMGFANQVTWSGVAFVYAPVVWHTKIAESSTAILVESSVPGSTHAVITEIASHQTGNFWVTSTTQTGAIYGGRLFTNLTDAQAYYDWFITPETPTVTTDAINKVYKFNTTSKYWIALPNTPPLGATEMANAVGVACDDNGYLLGNEKSFVKYDPQTRLWNTSPEFIGSPRYSPNMFAIDNDIYVGGGYDAGDTVFRDYYKYSVTSATWSPIPSLTGSVGKYSFSFSDGTKGVVGGGFSGTTYINDYYEYHPAVNTWTSMGTFANFDRANAACADNGYVLFGEKTNISSKMQNGFRYTDSWNSIATLSATYRSRAIAESIETDYYPNYIYYTRPSTSQSPNLCNLWAIPVNNYKYIGNPTYISQIPIATDRHWEVGTWSGMKYNSFFPMDIAANDKYVFVTQWHVPTDIGNWGATGSNYLNIGIRATNNSPLIATWFSQTLYDVTTDIGDLETSYPVPAGLRIVPDPYSDKLYAVSGYNLITSNATVMSPCEFRVPTNNSYIWHKPYYYDKDKDNSAVSYLAYFNLATYGGRDTEHNRSIFLPIPSAAGNLINGLLIYPTIMYGGLTKTYPANSREFYIGGNRDGGDTYKIYWDEIIVDGE